MLRWQRASRVVPRARLGEMRTEFAAQSGFWARCWALRLRGSRSGMACTVSDLGRFGTVDWRVDNSEAQCGAEFLRVVPSSSFHFKDSMPAGGLGTDGPPSVVVLRVCTLYWPCCHPVLPGSPRLPLRNPSGGHSPWAMLAALGSHSEKDGAPIAHVCLPSPITRPQVSLPCQSVPQPPHHHHTEASAHATLRGQPTITKSSPWPGIMSDAPQPVSPT